jgi:alkylation response protein AidB-like acyl-CoA dehydrogenase
MEFRDSAEEAAFRGQVRAFIAENLPPSFRTREPEWAMFNTARGRNPVPPEDNRAWRKRLAAKGWIAPAWPKEYGGAGMSIAEQFIFNEEMAEARAPGAGGIAVGWGGPTIMTHGTEEQKRRFLPGILSGEETWCQGFSEPGAGSDLASLQTRAVRDGDDYVINGQKIWTSGAHLSQYMILLARTDPDAPKHRGISYFVLDMKSPGINIQPLINVLGDHSFNQVFFDNVRVPRANLIGEENRGWYVGATTLDFERSSIATSVQMGQTVREFVAFARSAPDGVNRLRRMPALRLEIAERAVEAQTARLLSYQVISMQKRGLIPNKEASVAKLYTSELDQRMMATGMRLLGLYGQLMDRADPHAPLGGRMARGYLAASASTLGGGTSEIQRNIIATRGLGLPRG